MLILAIILAFYLAWNLGANDVANSMGTAVGSKAINLKQALIIAGMLELTGAVLFGQTVTANLATGILNPAQFADRPQTLLLGMLAVLLAAGIWMNLATWLGLPVSSSHATVGGLTGVGVVALGTDAVNWADLTQISLTWIATPIVSALIATLLYRTVRQIIAQNQLLEWIPWLSALLISIFGLIVFPPIVAHLHLDLPDQTLALGFGSLTTIGLTIGLLRQFSTIPPAETLFAQLQVISACFVAFAHGSNDVGNAIAPLATIVHIQSTGTVPLGNVTIPLWILGLGGLGIVGGLAVWGKQVIATIGAGIIPLQPSGGFCAELATAITILLASRWGLPVSTSHALVGGVVGIGLAQGVDQIQFGLLRSILLTWIATIPLAAGLAALVFVGLRHLAGMFSV
jgi:inorganic phosphate transporter, PiT family